MPDGLFVLELDFRLCRVYIHVDIGRINLEIDEIRHLHSCWHETVVGIQDRLVEIGMFHEAPIDEEIVVRTLLPGRLRFTDESADAAHGRLDFDRQKVLAEPSSKDVADTLAETLNNVKAMADFISEEEPELEQLTASVLFKLRGKVSAFPLLKLVAYLAILAVLLMGGTRARFLASDQAHLSAAGVVATETATPDPADPSNAA